MQDKWNHTRFRFLVLVFHKKDEMALPQAKMEYKVWLESRTSFCRDLYSRERKFINTAGEQGSI